MGGCLSTPVDFEGEVNLYHFDLHRVVGKGAFGKVSICPESSCILYICPVLSPGPGSHEAALDCGVEMPCSVAFVPPERGAFCWADFRSLAFDFFGSNFFQRSAFWTELMNVSHLTSRFV